MSKANKPIFSQPGGRGKLFTSTTGRSYEGTYLLPNGKYDRRIFKQPSNAKAIAAYTQWCAEYDEKVQRVLADAVKPRKPAEPESRKRDAANIPFNKRKEPEMATESAQESKSIFIVMVVGGVAVTWCDTFDKAAAVCDALTLGAKASGFAAKYDVVKVDKWDV